MKDYYRIKDVAAMLKLAPSTIRKYLSQGKLTGAKIDKIWRISQEDVDAFLAKYHTGGDNGKSL